MKQPSQRQQTQPEPAQAAPFSVRVVTATGHAFLLCGQRPPARLISAKDEHLDNLRQLAELLRRRQFVTDAYYRDLRDSLDYIAAALLIGKRNTAALRNHPPQ